MPLWEVSDHTAAILPSCFQELFKTTRSILMYFQSSFFSMRFVSVQVVHPYSSTDTTTACKKYHFISSERSDTHMIDNLLIRVHAFILRMLTPLSVEEILLPKCVNYSSNFRGFLFKVESAVFVLNTRNS